MRIEALDMRTAETDPVSPELVLVDPELAARVRPFAAAGPLHAPAPPLRVAEPRATPPVTAEPRDEAETRSVEIRSWGRRTAARFGSIAAVLATLGLLGAAFLPPRDAPRLTDIATPATAATPARLMLAWEPVADASYYLVEIFSGSRLVHAETSRATHVPTPSWPRPGRYTWRVYSGHGSPATRTVRGPLERGWFIVPG